MSGIDREETRPETRQERRARKLRMRRERMKKHGRSLVQIYRDAILKRLKERRGGRQKERPE